MLRLLAATLFAVSLDVSNCSKKEEPANSVAPAIGTTSTSQPAAPDIFFGLNDMFAGQLVTWATPWPSIPFGALRLWDGGTDWKQVEPSRRVYDWGTMDNWIQMAQSHGARVEFTFGRTPSWAAAAETLPPANMQDWDNFVTAVATRYKGKIEAYEVWNEVNSTAFYTGTTAQLVTMQQHAYNIIKSIDPSAIVLSPSFAGGGMGNLNSFLAGGAANYIDGVAVHLYPWPQQNPTPEVSISGWIATYRSYMTQNGVGNKPLWNTEYGWGLNTSLPNADDQAAFLARSYLLFWSEGIPRTYWYAYDNDGWGTLWDPHSGNPGTLTAAGKVYNTIHSWIAGSTMTQPCAADSKGTWSCGFSRSGGTQDLVMWNPSQSLSVSPPSNLLNFCTLDGAQGAISGAITVGSRPLLLESAAPAGSH
jgi:hypothetical protein